MATKIEKHGNLRQRDRILEKASALFWVNGYEKTSIKDIARSCSFEASNIYNYFSSKEQILYEILQEETERVINSTIKLLDESHVKSPSEQIQILIKNQLNLLLRRRRSSGMLFDVEFRSLLPKHRRKIVELRDAYENMLRRIIRAGIDSGDFAPIDINMACLIISSMILRVRLWYSPKGRLSPSEIADFIYQFALKGLNSDR